MTQTQNTDGSVMDGGSQPRPVESGSEPTMNLEAVSDKHLHEMERLAKELLAVMHKARWKDAQLIESLRLLEIQAGKVRRERFDATDQKLRGY